MVLENSETFDLHFFLASDVVKLVHVHRASLLRLGLYPIRSMG